MKRCRKCINKNKSKEPKFRDPPMYSDHRCAQSKDKSLKELIMGVNMTKSTKNKSTVTPGIPKFREPRDVFWP